MPTHAARLASGGSPRRSPQPARSQQSAARRRPLIDLEERERERERREKEGKKEMIMKVTTNLMSCFFLSGPCFFPSIPPRTKKKGGAESAREQLSNSRWGSKRPAGRERRRRGSPRTAPAPPLAVGGSEGEGVGGGARRRARRGGGGGGGGPNGRRGLGRGRVGGQARRCRRSRRPPMVNVKQKIE